ncbi:hypothetical protein [Hymenobacter cavernae]|uniref:Uncharacterized protein n=1 Tax=Hymenobacter cavernae TaxID=2044852 RepID=A0ABQ1UP94_9BACT|nr:hypothetical protein [Hymenobacter cavernae]GGF23487.1 hypothetical protein GCM10011383_38910 [Hymenobacter cavernae]
MGFFIALLPACRDARLLTVGPECNVRATVRDLTALDGCGFVLELPNGTRLSPDAQVWEGFTPYEGQQVLIRFIEVNRATTCQVGRPVHILCITEVQPTSGQY